MAVLEEHVQLYEKFPLLLHNADFTVWEGYLTFGDSQLKIKLNTPFYPDLKQMSFECAPVMKIYLSFHLNELHDCMSLQGFVHTLFHLVKKKLISDRNYGILYDVNKINATHGLLSELESSIEKENIVYIKDDFRRFKLKYRDEECNDHVIQFLVSCSYPKGHITILEADLPLDVLNGLSKATSIKGLYLLFKESVNSLLPFWRLCKDLEKNAWVIDPISPEKKDTHRRILISNNLSMILNFNPLNIITCPDIKFLGSVKAVTEARETCQKNIEMYGWIAEMDVSENVKNLLEIDELPVKSTLVFGNKTNTDNECYICFTSAFDDDEEPPPSKWCNNDNCSSRYHYSCLFQWLESLTSSIQLHDHIAGPCPYCCEKVWCPLKSEFS